MGYWGESWDTGENHGILRRIMGYWGESWDNGETHGIMGRLMGYWGDSWDTGENHGIPRTSQTRILSGNVVNV